MVVYTIVILEIQPKSCFCFSGWYKSWSGYSRGSWDITPAAISFRLFCVHCSHWSHAQVVLGFLSTLGECLPSIPEECTSSPQSSYSAELGWSPATTVGSYRASSRLPVYHRCAQVEICLQMQDCLKSQFWSSYPTIKPHTEPICSCILKFAKSDC